MLLNIPYPDWQPGENPVRHNEREDRIEVWIWSLKHRSWELVRVLPAYRSQVVPTSYQLGVQVIAADTETLGCGNPEYERGQLELLADLHPRPGVESGDRVEEIAADVRAFSEAEFDRATGESRR